MARAPSAETYAQKTEARSRTRKKGPPAAERNPATINKKREPRAVIRPQLLGNVTKKPGDTGNDPRTDIPWTLNRGPWAVIRRKSGRGPW